MKEVKVILFDVDGVIVDSEFFSVQYQKKYGVSNDEMLPFFTGVFQKCLVGEKDLKEVLKPWLKKWKWKGTADEFLQLWFESEHKIDSRMIKKIEQLKKAGIKCCLATKQEKYRTEYMRNEMGFEEVFDGIFSSAELGCKKPDPKFFEMILEELKVDPQEVLFFDDEMENVEGAKSLGVQGFLFVDFNKFEKDLKNINS